MTPASRLTPRKARTHFMRRGFTWKELMIVIVLLAVLAGGAWLFRQFVKQDPRMFARKAATQAKTIHGWLMSYADDHGGKFPTGANANEAYRELFKMNLGADEKQFFIYGDPYHKTASGGEPDGDHGREPDFARALEPGENAFAYMSGLNKNDTSRIPLIANGFSAKPGVWSKNEDEKGGVFGGKIGIVCRVGGSAAALALDESSTLWEKFDGQPTNIFDPRFEEGNFTVLNPQ